MANTNVKTKKAFGFFVMLLVAALAVVTALVYMNNYQKLDAYRSWDAVYIMIAGAAAAVVLGIVGFSDLSSFALAGAALVGLLLFAKAIYGYVVVVLVGIDLNSFDMNFIVTTALFAVSFVASLITMFLPQKKVVIKE